MDERAPRVSGGHFVLVANGMPDSPPASGMRDYLYARGAQVTTVHHPLGPEQQGRHHVVRFDGKRTVRRRVIRLPSRTPYTYPLDLLIQPRTTDVDGWIGFNNLMCLPGLAHRRSGKVKRVVYSAVDFVPDRFGRNSLMTRAYDAVDAYCCRASDARLEVSQTALDARDERLNLDAGLAAPAFVCPIGTWIDRVPQAPDDGWRQRRLVFIGHLVERMGIETMIEALRIVVADGHAIHADIAGSGPLEGELRRRCKASGLDDHITFHGFISDHRELDSLLAQASIALAPYSTRVPSFTRFADPSKLKSYLGAGLPVLLTDVPPNASELEREAGASVLADEAAAFAAEIVRLLDAPEEWTRRHRRARRHAERFDWNVVLDEAFTNCGFLL